MQFLVKIYTFASYETIINSYVWMRAYRHSLQVFVIVFKEGKSGIGIKKQKKTFLSGEKEERVASSKHGSMKLTLTSENFLSTFQPTLHLQLN